MAKLTPFFNKRIKILLAEGLLEINSRLGQLEKDNEYLRCAVQKTQSEQHKLAAHFKGLDEATDRDITDLQLDGSFFRHEIKELQKSISKQPLAITAAPLKAKRKRKPKRGGGHARR